MPILSYCHIATLCLCTEPQSLSLQILYQDEAFTFAETERYVMALEESMELALNVMLNEALQVRNDSDIPINEQMKCTIYKFFGSAFRSLKNEFGCDKYGKDKQLRLLSIVGKCVLTYDHNDFIKGQQNVDPNSEECKGNEYLTVPFRLRLQNRGYLTICNQSFFFLYHFQSQNQ